VVPSSPGLVLLQQLHADEAHGRLAAGEDADDALAAADLFVEPFDAVGRPQTARGAALATTVPPLVPIWLAGLVAASILDSP
jgi:hypothetical protein